MSTNESFCWLLEDLRSESPMVRLLSLNDMTERCGKKRQQAEITEQTVLLGEWMQRGITMESMKTKSDKKKWVAIQSQVRENTGDIPCTWLPGWTKLNLMGKPSKTGHVLFCLLLLNNIDYLIDERWSQAMNKNQLISSMNSTHLYNLIQFILLQSCSIIIVFWVSKIIAVPHAKHHQSLFIGCEDAALWRLTLISKIMA